mgnify:CR=1 FL=1|tara:strand:+ start:42350 stop:45469 length:3120 start_codon:yes stop_codon:yes gene_type:complete
MLKSCFINYLLRLLATINSNNYIMKTKFSGILTLLLAFLVQFSFAQEKIISGTVTDETGPLPGVSILIKGTSTGTETDFDGKYSINANVGDVLVFSFIGMTSQQKTVGATNTINVVLAADNILDEVVVIGYGQVSQRDLTTNVSNVKASEVQRISTANLAGALQGTASGVQVSQSSGAPGGEVRIRVRGSSSINGSNDPLYVIDGVPMFSGATISSSFGGQQNSALSNLNPDDIESVDILKDAASAAIYGDRGSNGVVIITTRKGKSGRAKFNFSSYVGFQNAQDRYETMNYGEFLAFGDASHTLSNGLGWWSTVWDGRQNLIGATQTELNAFYDLVRNEGDNYIDEIYVDDAPVINTNFNVSGGDEDTQYYLGVSQFTQDGVLLAQDFNRNTVRLNLTQKLTDKLSFTGGISLTDENLRMITNDNNIYGVLSTAILEAPGYDIYNADGSFNVNDFGFSNPVQNALEDSGRGYTFRLLGNADLQYKVTDNLTLNTSYGLDQLNFRQRIYNPPTSSQGSPSGFSSEAKNEFRRIKVLQSVNYTPKITDDIRLRVFLAGEYERNTSNFLSANVTGFTSSQLRFLSQGSTPGAPSSSFSEEKRVSVISRVGATFFNKLIVELSLRADASSKFNNDDRWGYFPAASVGYILSEEDWFQNDFINYFKVRGSWGVTGNTSAVGRYDSQSGVASGTYGTTGTSALTLSNPFITWEETSQYDAGFEAKFLDNRISLGYAYYNKSTNNNSLILSAPIPNHESGGSIPANIGEIENSGHEIDLSIDVFRGENFNWTTNFGFSSLDNKVLSLGGTAPFGTGFVSRVEEGAPLGAFRLYETDGLYQSDAEVPTWLAVDGVGAGDVKYVDQNNDQILNDDDFIIAGKPYADYTINWSNDMSYKNFDLSFLWALSEGNDVFNNNLQFAGVSGGRTFGKFKSQLNYWTPTNTGTDIPRANFLTASYNNRDGTRLLEDGSYIKLRNVTLGYTLPKIEGFDKIRVYVSGDNLVLITDYSGIDPEVNFNGAPGVTGGTDFLTQGANKVWKFGINVSF